VTEFEVDTLLATNRFTFTEVEELGRLVEADVCSNVIILADVNVNLRVHHPCI
jgi:hypothetical protein